MNEILWYVYTSILGIVLALGCAYVITKANDTIQKINNNIKARRKRHELLRRQYELQHRFDKPPLAKCYCEDCSYRSKGVCNKFGRYVADDFFCRHANPHKEKGEDRSL